MDYLQYSKSIEAWMSNASFKPYYKWITFNIEILDKLGPGDKSFKPYYKWITFNIA